MTGESRTEPPIGAGASTRPAPTGPAGVDECFRRSAGEVVAVLTRRWGSENLELVEEAVQEAFVKALRTWPFQGIPDNPRGWIYRVAARQASDTVRGRRRRAELLAASWTGSSSAPEETLPDPERVADDELALLLLCCHESLSRRDRVVLTLKVACGFSVPEIAASFLSKPTAIAQRLVRAKRKLRDSGRETPAPTSSLLAERGPDLREVVYLLFSGGHAALGGDALVRSELCAEALRVARLMMGHPGGEHPATRALAALMCFHAARLPSRTSADGVLVPLEAQDRSLWDRPLLAEGFHHLERAADGEALTRYHIEAGIAAVHATAARAEETDWRRLLSLYDRLSELHPSPVVSLNRAVAVGRAHGAKAGLDAARRAGDDPALQRYHLRPAVIGAFLEELGDGSAAVEAFREAAALAPSTAERRYLESRIAGLEQDAP